MSGKTLRWLAVLLFLVAVLMALRLIGPKVPNEIRMLSGPEGTTYHDDALRYQEFLGRHGVTVHLEQTSGSVENLKALIDADQPTVGFVSGLLDASGKAIEDPEDVESLGTMYLQPLWVFASKAADLEQLRDLIGTRVEAGSKGSDARSAAFFLLSEEGISDEVDFGQESPLTPEGVLEVAENDKVTAVIAVGEPDSEVIDLLNPVQMMIGNAGRSARNRRARDSPVRWGMVWSVITRSNASGSAAKVSRASTLLDVATTW